MLFALAALCLCQADDNQPIPPPDIAILLDELAANKKEQVAHYKKQLATERRSRVTTPAAKQEKKKRIAELQAKLEELARPEILVWPFVFDSESGYGVAGRVKIEQVVSEDSMIVNRQGKKYLVTGIDTGRYADERTVELDGIWQRGETFTYTTVIGGSNTVPTMHPWAEGVLNLYLDQLTAAIGD